MNILFLSLGKYWSVSEHEIYTDLLREFIKEGNQVYILSPIERREKTEAKTIKENGSTIIKVKTGNIQKTNIIEKGISTLLIEYQFLNAIKRNLSNVKFDLVLYPTPPITFVKVVEYIKKRDHAKTYLMLKDIFPQNAVDIGMMTTTGIKGFIYKFFRNKEKKLYSISDYIGCMSQANVDYVIKHNHEVDPNIVEVCPNSVEIVDRSVDEATRIDIRNKYGIPIGKKVFVYGGNLGKPQGINFMIECLKEQKNNQDIFFLIVGNGTEFERIEEFINKDKPANVKLMHRLPREDYDKMVGACDVGLIFLDHRFTIPNFPSRLLSYMQAKMPVLAVTDANTDIGKVIVNGGFGWWCESNDVSKFSMVIESISDVKLETAGKKSWTFLNDNYSVKNSFSIIMRHLK